MIPLLLAAALAAPQDWSHWRGEGSRGVTGADLPLEFDEETNLRWAVPLPGRGVSTPLVLGDRVILTTAVALAEREEPEEPERGGPGGRGGRGGRGGGRGRDAGPQVEQSFRVLALERASGEELWNVELTKATPHEGYHRNYGSFASASPATDGEHLYVSFGSQGVFALDLDGKELWRTEVGELSMRRQFGEGHAPVLAGNALILCCDHEGDSFIVALDKKSGEELWRHERDEPSAWATPLVTEVDGQVQVVTSSTNRLRAYDPADGRVIWECGGLGLNAIPAVVRHEDVVIAMSGYREAAIVGVRLGGEGDLTGTDAVVWSSKRGCGYTASPVLHGGLYYTVTDRGLASCFDAATGEAHYLEERLPRNTQLKSSPLGAGGHLFVPTESGDVHVLAMGPAFEVVRTNSLGDHVFVASPAAADGELYLRSMTHLLCVAETPREE